MPGWRLDRIKILMFEKSIRDERRITYKDIVDATGVSWPTVERYANGRAERPDPANVAKIAKYFGVSIQYFLEDSEGDSGANQNRRQVVPLEATLA